MSATAKTAALVLLTALASGAAGYLIAVKTTAARHAGDGAASGAGGARKVKFYQSPMHPWIKSDRPGKCTICGMDLAPVYEGEEGFGADGGGLVTLTPAAAAVIGVETSPVTRGPLARTLRVTGVLDEDETLHRVLSAQLPGRIEKLHINTIGAAVEPGAPLVTLYSPEMLSAQRQYAERLRAGSIAFTASELADARERLLSLGLAGPDVAALERSLQPSATFTLRAPAAGTVITRHAYEGQWVQTNDQLFETGDFSHLWFVFDAYETDLPWLRAGLPVDVSTPSLPGEILTAPIDFIDPNLDPATRVARVRVVLDNTARRLRHRQTAYGLVRLASPDTLLVPRSAVLFTRAEPLVYLDKTAGAYEPRPVKLGTAGDTHYAVLAGLREGDRVVTQGALLIDGQAQLAQSASAGEADAAGAAGGADGAGGGGKSQIPNPKSQKNSKEPNSKDAGGGAHAAHATHASDSAAAATHAAGAAAPPIENPKSKIENPQSLRPLVLAAADAADALAADDLARYQRLLPALHAALAACLDTAPGAKNTPLARFAAGPDSGLKPGPALADARAAYEPFSTALADLARAAHLHHGGLVVIYQCPMTPVLGTGRWVQRPEPPGLRNPFFGSAMLECGEEVK
ncbi:MAG: efflux RND transporter periplasmic adaptor subunit [Opitutaceae bacterium]|jgi:Cu(I)/Ag(I) efflux system membrane fusion protein|nr:efflux RND transporter periplasmic adaptor subunit [Opitutaceae bacterium]